MEIIKMQTVLNSINCIDSGPVLFRNHEMDQKLAKGAESSS